MASTRRTTSELCTSTTMSPCEATPELCHLINACTRKQVASKHESCPALTQIDPVRTEHKLMHDFSPHLWHFKGCLLLRKRLPMTFSGAVSHNTVSMHAWA